MVEVEVAEEVTVLLLLFRQLLAVARWNDFSPQIGSKCFNFQGSSLFFSLSASVFNFIWFSGVNSPSERRSRHSKQARAKNSLLRLDGPSRMPSVGTVFAGYLCSISIASRSTLGSNCIKLY